MTKHLPKNFFFTVVTNSIVIAEELRKLDEKDIEIIIVEKGEKHD